MTALDTELFLPEPEARAQRYTVISVDDHVVEPAHTFEGRLPAARPGRAPRIVETPQGHQVWEFEGERYTQVGMNAVAGRRPETYGLEPFRFDQMRPGCYDVDARVRDMDINGVWASVELPVPDHGLLRPGVLRLPGPRTRARRASERGTTGSSRSGTCAIPIGSCRSGSRTCPIPSVGRRRDPPQRRARLHVGHLPGASRTRSDSRRCGSGSTGTRSCEAVVETDTVVSLHVGSSGIEIGPPGGAPLQIGATLFGQRSLTACAEWLWSEYPLRHPTLKIAMSEGGIGWVAMLLDRLDNMVDRSGYGRGWDIRPAEVVRRNFWFCTIDDPSTIDTRHAIGVENIMVEVDYPHGDGTWPDTQRVIEECWGHIPTDELRAMCCENAAALYRHPLPDPCCRAERSCRCSHPPPRS